MNEPAKPSQLAANFNKNRLERAKALLPVHACHLLELLPSLFHFNQKSLPGWLGHEAPYGILNFNTEASWKICSKMGYPFARIAPPNPAILGLYTMGSLGSFGFHESSDLDVWLIHDSKLSAPDCELLAQKCRKIEAFFLKKNVHLNCYLVHPDQFIQGHEQVLGADHSGSAQHWLLLEEFYRSHIRLEGMPIQWWPSESQVDANHLLLGHLNHLPASEYFSASLWQMFKGIDNPHKALLKILLLEVYAEDYPNPKLVSHSLWHDLVNQPNHAHDPYLTLLDTVTQYLKARHDYYRLNLMRQCFYIKSGVKVSQEAKPRDWRHLRAKQLVQEWGWTERQVRNLDQIEQWRAGDVRQFNDQLNQLLMISYQKLVQFASKYDLNYGFRFDELGVLTRKLHTRFSDAPSSIKTLIPFAQQDLSEAVLHVIELGGQEDPARFALIPKRTSDQSDQPANPYFETESLTRTIFWGCVNGIATENTQWHTSRQPRINSAYETKKTQALAEHFLNGLLHDETVGFAELKHPWSIRQVFVVLNQLQDPTQDLSPLERFQGYLSNNLFSLGSQQKNLIGSVELIWRNSWNEWHYEAFAGNTAYLQAFCALFAGAFNPNSIDLQVFSCAQFLTKKMTKEVLFAIYTDEKLFHCSKQGEHQVQAKVMGNEDYLLFFSRQGVHYQALDDPEQLLGQYTQGQINKLNQIEAYKQPRSPVLELIYDHAAMGMTQYFVRQLEDRLDVFISDQDNQLREYDVKQLSLQELMRQVNKVHVFDHHKHPRQFNVPQFYWIKQDAGAWHLQPFDQIGDLNPK